MPADVRTAASAPELGLTDAEAARRLSTHGRNELPRANEASLRERLLEQLREPMAVLLVAAAIISGAVLGEVIDAVAIVLIVVVNAIIALVQEGRAKQALAALEQLEAPDATVIRGGRQQVVDAAMLVPGDLVLVQAGDRVPADLELSSGDALEVDEAILTGESLPSLKRPGGTTGTDAPIGDRDGMLHSGTFVTRGAGRGVVIATGTSAALGSIAQQLSEIEREPTPLQRQLAGLTRRLGLAALAVASGTFLLIMLRSSGGEPDEAFLTAVALAVAAVPEGLAAVTSVALALGVRRMARRGAIVRRLPAVETLGAVDVLVVDKTGTITENRMRIAGLVEPDGASYGPDAVADAVTEAVVEVGVLCNDATLDPPGGDPTERALLELTTVQDATRRRAAHPRLASAPFTSERQRMSTVNGFDGRPWLLCKGAPEQVLPRCSSLAVPDGVRAATDEDLAVLLAVAETHAARGERVLALARRRVNAVPDDVEAAEHDLTVVALVALRDPPRDHARGSVARARSAGVTLLMATGDHPATARAIAGEVGIDATHAMAGPDLDRDGVPDEPTDVSVYARVAPEQKLALVTRLQERGHTVAMTGDGVNDAPALQRADIGVALGATGSDVARAAADLVITDDDLATIVAAIREGRGIYDNLRKVVDYLVASNLAEVTVVVATLLLLPAFGVPLFPLQLLWINLLTDGLPALALGVDPVDDELMQRSPRDAQARLLDITHLRQLTTRAVVLAGGALGALYLARGAGLDTPEARTVLFTSLVVAQVLYAFVVSRRPFGGERNRWLHMSAAGALGLHVLILVLPGAQTVFDTVTPSLTALGAITVGGLAPPLVLAALKTTRHW